MLEVGLAAKPRSLQFNTSGPIGQWRMSRPCLSVYPVPGLSQLDR